VTPREFCRQSLEALRLPAAGAAPPTLPELEALLGCFADDDLPCETFARQLQLLAESEVCPCLAAAAARLLSCWVRQEVAPLARAGHRN
jgi:hypothetical protein